MTISFRIAGVGDAALVSELGARLFEQTFGAANTVEDMRDYLTSTFRPELQTAELADPMRATVVAEDETGTAVGYAMMVRDSGDSSIQAQHPAEIQRIYVDRTLHGAGAGAALMSACIDQARAWDADVIWLAVWERNPRAIAFYEKSGFRRTGRKTFKLGSDLQHDFVMARNLSS
jgi:ribosomal protein S18 acetylase RimI-like enzyme